MNFDRLLNVVVVGRSAQGPGATSLAGTGRVRSYHQEEFRYSQEGTYCMDSIATSVLILNAHFTYLRPIEIQSVELLLIFKPKDKIFFFTK